MKHPDNHSSQSSSSTNSKVTGGIASKSSPLTHPWWIYRANQLNIRNNHGVEAPAQIDLFPDEPPADSEDRR